MYYNNIYFHNVNLMKKDENGHYLLSRFREDVLINAIPEKQTQKDDSGFNLYEAANTYNYSQYNSFVTEKSVLDPFKAFEGLSLGAELRFKLVSDVVKIKLKLLNGQNPALCEVFFGNFFAGKDYCLTITDYNVIEIELKKLNK